MQPAIQNEVAESVAQLADAWRWFTTAIEGAERHDEPGLAIAYGDVPLPFMNASVLTDAVSDVAALDGYGERASAYIKARKFPGLLFVCDDMLAPEVRAHAAETLAKRDLH